MGERGGCKPPNLLTVAHNGTMSEDIRKRADQLAELMAEFNLSEARLEGDDWRLAFRKKPKVRSLAAHVPVTSAVDEVPVVSFEPESAPVEQAPAGIPVSSPMTGIFYGAPSPSAPPFVKEGDTVNAGAVVGLIEAMKVFNEIVAPQSGIVRKIVAKSGEVVNPGEPLLYIG